MRRVRNAVLVGFATLNLFLPVTHAVAGSGSSDEEYRARFFDSQYTMCDADALASAWKLSLDEAKAHIGRKIDFGATDVLSEQLQEARVHALEAQSVCYYFERGENISYDDVETLSRYWGLSIVETKATIGYKLATDPALLNDALQSAQWYEQRAATAVDDATSDLDAFFASRFQYCDALMLSQHWQISLDEAKTTIGYKVRNSLEALLVPELDAAREAAHKRGEHCYIELSPTFSESNIAKLERHWGVDRKTARNRVDDMLAAGKDAELQKAIEEFDKKHPEKKTPEDKPVKQKTGK